MFWIVDETIDREGGEVKTCKLYQQLPEGVVSYTEVPKRDES